MKISVIIPVYNAEKFVQKAVKSALHQAETFEVLLIEDGSTDNSLFVCKDLSKKYSRVSLFRHPDGRNRGAGATRNLGITKAKCEYVAFLDADDYFLPNRFRVAKQIFAKKEKIDGVYEAIGMHFYDQKAKQAWISSGGELLTTLTKPVHPKNLFRILVGRNNGYIHLDGLVVRKSLFETCGCFPENLRLHQDTAIIVQFAVFGLLAPGNLKSPVALRGIHTDNRITQNKKATETRALLWETLFTWAINKPVDFKKLVVIYKKHIEASYQLSKNNNTSSHSRISEIKFLLKNFLNHPVLFSGAAAAYISQKN
jgi:glycosyltransferase involved in cell wall biosynthesis